MAAAGDADHYILCTTRSRFMISDSLSSPTRGSLHVLQHRSRPDIAPTVQSIQSHFFRDLGEVAPIACLDDCRACWTATLVLEGSAVVDLAALDRSARGVAPYQLGQFY